MEQRARVMGKAGPAAVYRKFINAMKKKTKEMKENKGLWANIAAKRERIKRGAGERMRKKGEKGAPTQDAIASAKRKAAANMGEDVPGTSTASIPNPADTVMGPRMNPKGTQDKRKRKRPAVLKRFARFIEPQND